MSGKPAARVGDKVAHSLALPGALTGLLIGAAIGVAIVATGGLGAIAIGAALATTGGLGLAGQYIGESIPGPPTGAIITGALTILINGRPAARSTLSTATCIEGPPQQEATGAATVLFETMPAGRKGELLTCSAKIIEGSPNVIIGGPSVQTEPIEPEVPAWLTATMQVMAIGGLVISTGGVGLTYGVGAAFGGLALGYAGSKFGAVGGRWAAQQLGLGETGQRVGEVLGGIGGGMLGGAAGFRGGRAFDSRYQVKVEGLGSNFGNVKIVPRQPPTAQQRAQQIHEAVPEGTRNRTTIAVTETSEGVRVVSSSEARLRPAQRRMLGPNEVEGTGPGHAEVTGVNAARVRGLTPTGTAASRPICANCGRFLSDHGIAPLSPPKGD